MIHFSSRVAICSDFLILTSLKDPPYISRGNVGLLRAWAVAKDRPAECWNDEHAEGRAGRGLRPDADFWTSHSLFFFGCYGHTTSLNTSQASAIWLELHSSAGDFGKLLEGKHRCDGWRMIRTGALKDNVGSIPVFRTASSSSARVPLEVLRKDPCHPGFVPREHACSVQ
jgi:hypothetical protein